MSSTKQQLLQELQLKKQQLRDIQEKCQLQNVLNDVLQKKIKLYRKENQELSTVVEERNQTDTNLLLKSKELLTANAKLEKTIQDLRLQLISAQQQQQRRQKTKPNVSNKQQSDNTINQSQSKKPLSSPIPSIVTIRDTTITQSTLEIDLPSLQLTDDEFLSLQPFTQLKYITVNDNELSNSSVAMICEKFTLVQKLNLANNKFQASPLSGINNLINLTVLDIRNNNLGDEALKYISTLGKLKQLSCSKNILTDHSANYLSLLTNLTYLDMTSNQLTSSSIESFNKLQKLTHLYLMSNRVSKQGIIQLITNNKSLLFLDVRFNVWNNEEKQEIKDKKPNGMQVFC